MSFTGVVVYIFYVMENDRLHEELGYAKHLGSLFIMTTFGHFMVIMMMCFTGVEMTYGDYVRGSCRLHNGLSGLL